MEEYAGIAIVPLIVGLCEVCKRIDFNPKFIPVLALLLGLGAGIALYIQIDILQAIVTGLFYGLSAAGLYSGVKNTTEGIKEIQNRP